MQRRQAGHRRKMQKNISVAESELTQLSHGQRSVCIGWASRGCELECRGRADPERDATVDALCNPDARRAHPSSHSPPIRVRLSQPSSFTAIVDNAHPASPAVVHDIPDTQLIARVITHAPDARQASMATPSSSATTPSPQLHYLQASTVASPQMIASTADNAASDEERQRAIQKFMARAEISKVCSVVGLSVGECSDASKIRSS